MPIEKKSIGRDFVVKLTGATNVTGYVNMSTSLRCDSHILELNPVIDDVLIGSGIAEVTLVGFMAKISYNQAIEKFDSAGYKPAPFSVFLDFAVQNIGVVNFSVSGEPIGMSNKKPRVVCLSKVLTKNDQEMSVVSFYRTQISITQATPYLFEDFVYYTDKNGVRVNNGWENNEDIHTAFLVMKK